MEGVAAGELQAHAKHRGGSCPAAYYLEARAGPLREVVHVVARDVGAHAVHARPRDASHGGRRDLCHYTVGQGAQRCYDTHSGVRFRPRCLNVAP